MKTALITGITGQDGAYLAKFLLSKGYKVYGTYRRVSTPNFWRLQYLDIFHKVNLISADLTDSSSINEAIRKSEPDEIYNLAAQSFVAASFQQPTTTAQATGLGVINILEGVRTINPNIRVYQASTSEMFGNVSCALLNEDASFQPASPYGAAKLFGFWMTNIYRESYGIFACNGILFNHESPLRGLEFVTRKITNGVAKIKLGLETTLTLGNLDTKRDWGYAPDFVEAMWLMLQQNIPDSYVIATSESHSVREFVELAFNLVDLDWTKYVKFNKSCERPLDIDFLRGDCSKAQICLGWSPRVKFAELVDLMVREDLTRWQRWSNGERFNWDAPNYPNESIPTATLFSVA